MISVEDAIHGVVDEGCGLAVEDAGFVVPK